MQTRVQLGSTYFYTAAGYALLCMDDFEYSVECEDDGDQDAADEIACETHLDFERIFEF